MIDMSQIREIAHGAGERILEYYDVDPGVTYKSDNSPLTKADQAAHDFICSGLRDLDASIPVLSEEGELPTHEERAGFERFWLIDSLDGTREFIKRNNEFTVNIALIENGSVVAGVVHVPVKGETYFAVRGEGAFHREGAAAPRRLKARASFESRGLRVGVSRSHPDERTNRLLDGLQDVVRVPLGSSLKFCRIASGDIDFYPRFQSLHEWDVAAAQIVVEESGGLVWDANGVTARYNKPVMKHEGGFLAASCEALARHVAERMQRLRGPDKL